MKNLFVTSTRHNEGKTVVTLGMTASFSRRVRNIGFIKPVGKGSVEFAGEKLDHDVALIKEACKIPAYVRDMGPVVYDGFPTAWISQEGREAVLDKIKQGYARVSANKNLVVIEGTGNAAAGAAFGLSNAFIAKMLNAKVVLVASGGVGQPTDEIILNKAYFERAGVEVLGVIVNKAYPHEYERIDKWMRRVLEMMGVRLLGVIPYESDLARATMLNLFERFRGKVINAEPGMGAPLGKIVLGAMSAGAALDQLTGQVTLICPVDREDLLVAALSAMYISGRKDFTLSSIVICGKEKLSETLTKMIKRTTIPVLQVDQDIYTVMADVHASNFKILPSDTEKIRMAIEVVQNHVNLDATLEGLQEA
ncbi:MAG TPA: AAA family ATPase [Planctomycetota bacterium]|nr:AAA family ATPase [Planctomycetota bacterium]